MILIVTNREDYTADFLIIELRRRAAPYIRFNTEDFPQKVRITWTLDDAGTKGCFLFPDTQLPFIEATSVWYRRPASPTVAPSVADPMSQEFVVAESRAVLENVWRCLDCFWVSHPDNLRRAESKLLQLMVAREIGLTVWPTLVTNDPDDARAFYAQEDKRIIYKPLADARLLREDKVSLIYTNPVTPAIAKEFDSVSLAPVLLQRMIPKRSDIRVTTIGERAFAVEILSQEYPESMSDWRKADVTKLKHKPHQLPKAIEAKCIRLVRALNLAFGAIDLVLTPDGEYVFLEINPNGQWAWIQQLQPSIPLRETLADLLIEGRIL